MASFRIKVKNIAEEFKVLNKKLDNNVKKDMDTKVVEMKEALVSVTPIDTGFARASWSTNKDKENYIIKNTAPYISALNHGHSKQAPSFFIEKTVLAFGTPKGSITVEEHDDRTDVVYNNP